MAKDTKTRIEQRTHAAEVNMKDKPLWRRAIGQTGLFIANGMDYLTGWADNERVVFAGATAAGLLRGALYGGIGAIIALALLPHIAIWGPVIFMASAGVTSIVYGIRDGQQGLQYQLNKSSHTLSDTVAEKSGAVPSHKVEITKSPEETLKKSGRDPNLEKRVQEALKGTPPATPPAAAPAPVTADFAKREEAKRVAAAATAQNPRQA